jgi:outer membrane lipoprotein-sorting protein
LNGTQSYVIRENFGGLQKFTFIEKDNYLIVRIVIPNGKDKRTVVDLSDYKTVKGFSVPFKIRISVETLSARKAKVSEIKIISFRTDVKFDDSIFTLPNISHTSIEIPGLDIKSILKGII